MQVVRALFAYAAQQPDELSFADGEVLVLSQENKDWWLCKSGEKQGLVPSNYDDDLIYLDVTNRSAVGENTATIDNPLHEAAKRGNTSFVQELLAAGVSANGLDKAGNAPLHWAARGGHAEVVAMLLSKNVTLNARNKLGDTPLHLAAWGGHADVIKLLLEKGGIDVTIKNKNNETALQLAKSDDAAALLLNYSNTKTNAGDLAESDEEE
ncbi:Osteoclast-stimulating factor 1 [Kappamyces sp. JEL0829]|nr:Osteoclast-stimulating factor 1 [Kappamyces sp. JEL0829]